MVPALCSGVGSLVGILLSAATQTKNHQSGDFYRYDGDSAHADTMRRMTMCTLMSMILEDAFVLSTLK